MALGYNTRGTGTKQLERGSPRSKEREPVSFLPILIAYLWRCAARELNRLQFASLPRSANFSNSLKSAASDSAGYSTEAERNAIGGS
jgi:hypothetical protein